MILRIFILLLLPVITSGQSLITGQVEYDLTENLLSAQLELNIANKYLNNDTLSFILNTKSDIKELNGPSVKNYNFEEFYRIGNARSNYLTIILDTAKIEKVVRINLKYEIDNYTDELWSAKWFEFHSELKAFPINSNIQLDLNLDFILPEEFICFGSSSLKKVSSTNYSYIAKNQTWGPTIFGGEKVYKKHHPKGTFSDLKLYSYFDEYGMMDTIYNYVQKATSYYHNSFAKNNPISDFSFAIIPFINTVSFQRDGFTTYRYFRQGDRFINGIPRTLGTPYHEICHLWWSNASSSTYDNWLNESFAEYFSYMAIRDLHGIKEYEKLVERSKRYGEDYGPVIEFKNGQTSVLYTKGAYIVYELHQKLGESDFIEFSQKLIDRKIATVDSCLDLIKNEYSSEISEWLYQRLRE